MEWMANETDPMAKELKRQFDEYLGELGLHEASTWDKYEGTLYQAARDWFGVDRGRRPMKEWLDEECWAAVQAKMSAADRYAWWDDKRRVSGGQASSQSDLQEGEGTLSGRDDCSGRSGVEDGQTSGGMELFAQGHRRQNREVREAQEGAPDRARNH